ncbi:sporulation protein YabP [Sporosalibacterium faouarense]|uniref:sporulation protein YabP n=1 Tax=Sporosalibacterium faouarense TaxID=516123 RepID=UPI00141C7846|nr:sporulation protein YabP [Sporosalibacterium faouarense]MTI46490.1 sporulation protein YabP [Bacillota bacterium]
MNENKQTGKTSKNQNIILENREKLSISGVEHVDSFNENIIAVQTNRGLATIKGNSLNISKLNLDDGNVIIEGSIDSIIYSDRGSSKSKGNGLLSKMFK